MPGARERQAKQEQAFPENFEDAGDWIRLSELAATTATNERTIGTSALREAYESARLRGRFVTLDGLTAIDLAMRTHTDPLRQSRSPIEAGRHKLALQVLTEARKKPSARATWGRVLTSANVGGFPEFAYRQIITGPRARRGH